MRFLFSSLPTACLIGSAAVAQAQQFPVPGAKNSDWILQKVPPLTGMPTAGIWAAPDKTASTADAVRSGTYNGETKKLLSFFDRRTGVFYNVDEGWLHDRTTNTYYRFHRRGAQPQPLPATKFL
ncbi:hypothetical protein [Hymenobacter terrestris]|uniref:S9 family peptidase n=1 Tax=Hymenobacter terrestris TaxID=2748310 RepID=A0ABX2Q281_9BACT|nr:hypothetical protein [Hymenobacter terrestris]NVO84639.1 hypothetical protein [Hymenobacter terrestris]